MSCTMVVYQIKEHAEFRHRDQQRYVRIVECGVGGRERRVIARLPTVLGHDAKADLRYQQELDDARRMLAGLRGRHS